MADWASLKVVELKAELKRRGLAQAGLKAELVARLEAADREAAAAKEEPPNGEDRAKPEVEPEEAQGPVANGPSHAEPAAGATSELADVETKAATTTGEEAAAAAAQDSVEVTAAVPSNVEAGHPEERHESLGAAATEAGEREPVSTQPSRSSVMDESKKGDSADEMALESAIDTLKRKRRSASPTPKEDTVKRRRAEAAAEDAAIETSAPTGPEQDKAAVADLPAPETVSPDSKVSGTTAVVPPEETREVAEAPPDDVGPARHENTPAIYVNNLMRPMREAELRDHLVTLATGSGDERNDDIITKFYVDSIRTHAFVIFASTAAATRVRNRLHGRVWPQESNRKALFVDFVPADKVHEWIGLEESHSGKNKPGARWEVVYEADRDGLNVEAILRSTSVTSSSGTAPPVSRPTVPAAGVQGAPTGPRGYQPFSDQFGPSSRAPPDPASMREGRYGPSDMRRPRSPYFPDHGYDRTSSQPELHFQAVPPATASRRLESMRGFYTRELHRQLGREINRYSFQEEDKFVDRGREVFEGIRPPHRQQAMDRQRGVDDGRGRGRPPRRGPAPFRPRGDRYVPGQAGPVEDRPFRQGDDDGRPRY